MRRPLAGRIILLALIGAASLFVDSADSLRAATFPLVRDYLNRQQSNLTSGVIHQVFFTAATNLPGSSNSMVITFPDANDGTWCRTAGVDVTVSGLVNPDGASESATALPGTLTANCTQGSGGGSFDRITVNNVGPLSTGTKYGFQVSDGTIAKLGTPAPAIDIYITLAANNGVSDIDTGQIHTAIIANDAVNISAVVASTPPSTNPVVQIRGRASPGAMLSIRRDGAVVDTSVMAADATFDRLLADQPVGQHVYELSATDTDGRAHPPVTIATSLAADSTTVISGIFFAPTITSADLQHTVGDTFPVTGLTQPGSTVALVLSPTSQSYTGSAGADGRWTVTIDTTDLPPGTYTANATAVGADNAVSETSQAISFTLVAADVSTPVERCDGKTNSDVNCDASVNLIDFSIMLFYWNQRVGPDNRSDMNNDGIVNIVDFSILLYQWTGF